jgi:hypothetical protein
VEAFKATGADVLRQNAQVFMETAREQLVAQSKLSSQELEARQKAIDLSIKPLAEQLQKQERLVLELNLKREGDSKTLSAQVQSLIELQNQARDAALALQPPLLVIAVACDGPVSGSLCPSLRVFWTSAFAPSQPTD